MRYNKDNSEKHSLGVIEKRLKMKIREKGKKPATTSLLGFGCMRLPVTKDGKIDRPEAMKMMDYAYEHGVNYYDTAYFYHSKESEPVVGEWVKTKQRDTFYLATKSPTWVCKDIADFDRILDEQLANLQTDYVDFYLLHALNRQRWEQIQQMNLLPHLQSVLDSGKVRRIGFSFHDDYELFEEILNAYDWDFCQIQFNYMDVDIQAGMRGYELARSKNIPMVIMEPVKGGMLANVPDEIKKEFRSVHPDWSDASWALRWVGSHDNVMTVLSGMSTMDQVIDNVRTFTEMEELNEQELQTVDHARTLFNARIQVPCTACRYCMPCPFGLNIPQNFKLLNTAHVYNAFASQKEAYLQLDVTARASHCRKCGACVPQCPQHIDIPGSMAKVASQFED